MNDLRKAAEQALEALDIIWATEGDFFHYQDEIKSSVQALRRALAEPEDPRITELTTLMAERGVTGVVFEVHRGPLSKSIREYGECPCPTRVKGDVRIEVKE